MVKLVTWICFSKAGDGTHESSGRIVGGCVENRLEYLKNEGALPGSPRQEKFRNISECKDVF